MAVTGGSFPSIYGVFYMTVSCWCVWGPSCDRHVHRYREKGLPKPLSRHHDGDDAHDGHLRVFSQWGGSSPQLLMLSYPFSLTRRTRRRM
jgi:hypothetical protein